MDKYFFTLSSIFANEGEAVRQVSANFCFSMTKFRKSILGENKKPPSASNL